MKHYVYRTINLITNREYIGARSHPNPEVDSYLGSGVEIVKDIKILGINSFKKEILQVFSSRDEAELFETQLVSKEYLENTFTYNIALYGKNTKSFKRVKDKVWKEYDAIRDKYKSGLSCNIISKKYNCSPSTIKNIVKEILPKLKSDRFAVEAELTARVKNFRVCEVSISYFPRTFKEGKKIRWTDGLRGLWAVIYFNLFSNSDLLLVQVCLIQINLLV